MYLLMMPSAEANAPWQVITLHMLATLPFYGFTINDQSTLQKQAHQND